MKNKDNSNKKEANSLPADFIKKIKSSFKKNKKRKPYSKKDYKLIKKSAFFDADWYLQQYPDVKKTKKNPVSHYLKFGWVEGRNPSAKFNTVEYLKQNPDVDKQHVNPLLHYERFGKNERRIFTLKTENYKIIKESPYFDAAWVSNYYLKSQSGVDPVSFYLNRGASGNINPGPHFYSNEYLMINYDVKQAKMNPLIHYEKFGRKEGRCISFANMKPYVFPEGTISCQKVFRDRTSFDKNMVSVFASFSGNGKIDDYVLYLLRDIRSISDYVIFVADNPIFPEELIKIEGLCDVCIFDRHEEYDFGSYKRGYFHALENKLFTPDDNLLMINDANYGPVYSFDTVIEKFKQSDCDFYGLSQSKYPSKHIQSFFYIFKSKVFTSNFFEKFFKDIKKQLSASHVVTEYEMKLTEYLVNNGFSYDVFVDKNFFNANMVIPTKFGLTLLQKFHYPLVKIKAVQGSSVEAPQEIISYIQQENPELYETIQPHLSKRLEKIKNLSKEVLLDIHHIPDDYYDATIREIKSKIQMGEKVNVTFLVSMTSMFPAENLMKKLLQDTDFHVSLYVIPDVRFGNKEMERMYLDTFNELKQKYPFVQQTIDLTKQSLPPIDVIANADIICYPSPYDISYSLYNPIYAICQKKLSIHINYGFFRSKYDRIIYNMDNYNCFWKVFLETNINLQEYIEYGQCKGRNAVVTGYSKMDALNTSLKKKKKRKRIIIAPHHSVEGGTNKILSLSNFEQYADLFLSLPKLYPNIDWVFRPHPVLFTVLKRPNKWGEQKVNQYIQEMTSYKNVIYSTEGNYLDEFILSDGIIQDCGSFLVEYFYTGNPCCYMLKNPEDIEEKFTKLGQDCLSHCYVSYDRESIIQYIENVIVKGDDIKKIARNEFSKKEILINYPHATDSIIQILKNI